MADNEEIDEGSALHRALVVIAARDIQKFLDEAFNYDLDRSPSTIDGPKPSAHDSRVILAMQAVLHPGSAFDDSRPTPYYVVFERAALLIEEFAPRVQASDTDAAPAFLVAMAQLLGLDLLDDGEWVIDVLRKWTPSPAPPPGKRATNGVIAEICQRFELFTYTRKSDLDAIVRAVRTARANARA